MKTHSTQNIEDYLGTFIPSTQALLRKMCTFIVQIAPEAEEKISYGILTFTLNKNHLS